jgi:hypothetical protein
MTLLYHSAMKSNASRRSGLGSACVAIALAALLLLTIQAEFWHSDSGSNTNCAICHFSRQQLTNPAVVKPLTAALAFAWLAAPPPQSSPEVARFQLTIPRAPPA